MSTAPPIMIQARSGSARLPRKVLADLCGATVLEWVVERCRQSRKAGGVLVLTSNLTADDEVAEVAARLRAGIYRGSETDVLLRYVEAARTFDANALVRITADCPFIDPEIIDEVIGLHEARPADYVCVAGYPEGVGVSGAVRRTALEKSLVATTEADGTYREHVISYVVDHPDLFDLRMPPAQDGLRSPLRFSIDTQSDLDRARRIATYFHPSQDFRVRDLLAWASQAGES